MINKELQMGGGKTILSGSNRNNENLKKIEFDVLFNFFETGKCDVKEMARLLYKEEAAIENAIATLQEKGLVTTEGATEKGKKMLEANKIDNAVILAAGMSTRFVPLNYEKPKALLEVKGEVLIERQIRQLQEKGIKEIIIVVGYMKEKFEYLKEKYGVTLVFTEDFATKNNYASVYAAREYLKNTIITSSDLYFENNIFQTYAYDSYYCTIYIDGKTAERGIRTNDDDRIIKTMYGDKCYDIWVTLVYAFFSKQFSERMISIIEEIKDFPETANMFWADIQDEHLGELYMYAKRCKASDINEFDSLEELREFDEKYRYNSGSKILSAICSILSIHEDDITNLVSLRRFKESMFKFKVNGAEFICDVNPDERKTLSYNNDIYQLRPNSVTDKMQLYKLQKVTTSNERIDIDREIDELYNLVVDFEKYHEEALPLCAAENVISSFANLPLTLGFQERYIMNNTYSFNMDDNFIGCEKLYPFYQKLSDVCYRVFGAKYTDARPFTGMHCIDMITKTICKPGAKMMILGKEYGGHASVKPVVERLGVTTYEAPYDLAENDLDYKAVNEMIKTEGIQYVLLAPSDLIKPLNVELIDTTNCVLLYDCSQVMGLIAAKLCPNPLQTMSNIIMFGGTHKTFPGPASGLIMTNSESLHNLMETEINPKYLRHSQMHQKISLLFALIEFEKYGREYMQKMVHSANYIGKKLRDYGFVISDIHGRISETHQVHILTSKEVMDTIYENASRTMITLNKKHKNLFHGYGIRLGTQEIARYGWDDEALDKIALAIKMIASKDVNVDAVKKIVAELPAKELHYALPESYVKRFQI